MNPDADASSPTSSQLNTGSTGETPRDEPRTSSRGGNWKQKKKSQRKSKDPISDDISYQNHASTSSDVKVSPRSPESQEENADNSMEHSIPNEPTPEDLEKMRQEWSQICDKLRTAEENLLEERTRRIAAEMSLSQLGTEKEETEKELQENTAQAVKLATQLAIAQEDKELAVDAKRRALSQEKFSPQSRRGSEPEHPEVATLRAEIARLENREKAWKSERNQLEEEIQKHKVKSSELSTIITNASREPSPRRNKNNKRTPEEKLEDAERTLSKLRAEYDFSLLEKDHMQEEYEEVITRLEADRDKLLLELSKQHEPIFIPDKVTVATQIEGDLIGPTFTLFEVVSERGVAYRRTHGNLKDRVIDMLGPTFGESVAAQEIRGDWIYTIDGFWLPTMVDGLQALVPLRTTGDKLDKTMGDKLHSIWSRYNANRNESK